MTSQELSAEITDFRQEQLAQRKYWLRWGFVSNAIGHLLCIAALFKIAITGNDPPSAMIFVALTLIILGIVFVIAGEVVDVSPVAGTPTDRAKGW
jgi:uncharacterized membrane protein YhaH (DUF805 family)